MGMGFIYWRASLTRNDSRAPAIGRPTGFTWERPPAEARPIRATSPIVRSSRSGSTRWRGISERSSAMAKGNTPEVMSLSPAQLEQLLVELAALLPAKTYQLVEALLRTLQWLMEVVQKKGITLARLHRVLFGFPTEKTEKILPPEPAADSTPEEGANSDPRPNPRKRRGHGRQAADVYTGAEKIVVPHPELSAGDPCPYCGGRLGARERSRLVCIRAQQIFPARLYEAQVLRCNRCGKLFTAPLPAEAA